MPPSAKPVNVGRRFVWLGGIVIAVCVLYSGAWFYAAGRATDYLKTLLKAPGPGMSADCAELDIRGFPFRAGVFCASARIDDPSKGLSITTGAVRTMTLVYNPTKAVFEIDSPVKTVLANGATFDTTWGNFDGSIGASLSGLTRASIFIDKMATDMTLPAALGTARFTSDHAELHARQDGPDLDLAARSDASHLETALIAQNLPEFSTSLEATLDGRANILEGVGIAEGEAIQGRITRFAIDFGKDGFLAVSGPFKIAENGLLSGQFAVEVEDFTRLQAMLSERFPKAMPIFDTAAILFKSLSSDGKTGKIEVTVRDGRIFLGIIPLGAIPPI